MQDKDMVNDVLSMLNSSVTNYSSIITQCSNLELRQTIQQLRNNCETSQFDMYKIAEQKGFYKSAQQATESEIMQVKNQIGS
jgi:spore coat protein CotF